MDKKVEAVTASTVLKEAAHRHAKLTDIQEDLVISEEKLLYAIKNGYLKTAIELPLCLVERLILENYELLEGLVGARPKDAYDILNDGYKELQRFTSIDLDEPIRLVNDFQQYRPVLASKKTLVVIESHVKEFKVMRRTLNTLLEFEALEGYSKIILQGLTLDIAGDKQRRIIKQLHEALLNSDDYDDAWVASKILIDKAGSQADHIRDIFSNKAI